MLTINPRNLKTARNNRRWTQDQLAEKAKVEKGTISRIERGELTQARVKTAQKLSQALSISIEELMGDVPLEAKPPAGKSTISVTIVNRARNALELVKRRYRVSTATVYELAPLLFFLAAEQMLVERQEKVEQLKQQLESVKAGGGTLISETRQQDLALILDELNHVHTSTVSRELFEDGARSSSGDVALAWAPLTTF